MTRAFAQIVVTSSIITCLILSGCGAANAMPKLHATRLPDLLPHNYEVRGSFPELRGSARSVEAVNALIRHVIRTDELKFGELADRQPPPPEGVGPGLYAVHGADALSSVTSSVVSFLLPVTAFFPGGNDGERWLAVTIDVHRRRRVQIGDLFTPETAGLTVLARTVRQRALATNECVRRSIEDRYVGGLLLHGFLPKPANYRQFALLTDGIVVGFPVGRVAFPPCNRVRVLVPYQSVRKYLSPLGVQLVAAVQSAK